MQRRYSRSPALTRASVPRCLKRRSSPANTRKCRVGTESMTLPILTLYGPWNALMTFCRYQGTWINYRRGREFCRQYGVEELLRPLLDYDISTDGSGQPG